MRAVVTPAVRKDDARWVDLHAGSAIGLPGNGVKQSVDLQPPLPDDKLPTPIDPYMVNNRITGVAVGQDLSRQQKPGQIPPTPQQTAHCSLTMPGSIIRRNTCKQSPRSHGCLILATIRRCFPFSPATYRAAVGGVAFSLPLRSANGTVPGHRCEIAREKPFHTEQFKPAAARYPT